MTSVPAPQRMIIQTKLRVAFERPTAWICRTSVCRESRCKIVNGFEAKNNLKKGKLDFCDLKQGSAA
ncbi:hypothetical protein L596_012966 [Steinernema carpocapsae]|uniref:Uncharacterized protein n=1 Tax=Steinernema carpocapsae TaxID=34508 RepID=A0A4U5NYN6_STECR|nr:hypothetical protein L596_012966 [Steinernema carpocapsae]